MNKKYQEFINSLKTKKIAIIGAGVSNLPLIKILHKEQCNISIFDKKELSDMEETTAKYIKDNNLKTSLGTNYLEQLVGFDIIFRSPSMLPTNPYLVEEEKKGALITTEVEQVIKLSPCKVIGVTGSKGKTTTTTILYKILTALGHKAYLGGNIGTPLFKELNNIKENDIVVLELSSFQLMNMTTSPDISIITNISPDHLDVHASYEEYIESKKNIFTHQTKDDIIVLNLDDNIVSTFQEEAKGQIRYFKNHTKDKSIIKDTYVLNEKFIEYNDEPIIDTTKLLLKGNHNFLNICAALNAIKDYINVSKEELEAIITKINGVSHRLEFVRDINGVKWYNDSASTTPDKSLAGIYAFEEPIILIAGGYDKNISYTTIAPPILERVSKLILFGETRDKIYNAVINECHITGKNIPIYLLDTLEEVVSVANEVSTPGEIVLFSPASASFDMFKNAYQRGDLFKSFVEKI